MKNVCLIGLMLALLTLVGCSTKPKAPKSTPIGSVELALNALKNLNYAELKSISSANKYFADNIGSTYLALQPKDKKAFAKLWKSAKFSLKVIEEDEEEATVEVTAVFGDATMSDEIGLQKVDGQWEVNSLSSLFD